MYSQAVKLAAVALVGVVSMIAASSASARPPAEYRNWAQTASDSADVVFHPHGDHFVVRSRKRAGLRGGRVAVMYHYKNVDDKWKKAVDVFAVGRQTFRVRHNLREHRRIYFYVIGADGSTSIRGPLKVSEFRTT